MRKFILEVLDFYKNPIDTRIGNPSLAKNIKYIGYTLLLDALFLIIFIPIMLILNKEGVFSDDTSFINYKTNTLLTLFLVIGIVSFIEEILFRLPLRYNKFYSFFINRKKWNVIFNPFLINSKSYQLPDYLHLMK